MEILETKLSDEAQHAIQDMVELKMYLWAQSQQTPWCMVPRTTKKSQKSRMPFSTLVELTIARELIDRQLIEATSNRTFVVSKGGYQFYDQEVKLHGVSSDGSESTSPLPLVVVAEWLKRQE